MKSNWQQFARGTAEHAGCPEGRKLSVRAQMLYDRDIVAFYSPVVPLSFDAANLVVGGKQREGIGMAGKKSEGYRTDLWYIAECIQRRVSRGRQVFFSFAK